MSVSLLCYFAALKTGRLPTAALAAAGALAGELVSCLFSLILLHMEFGKYHYSVHMLTKPLSKIKEILSLSTPLTVNHVMVTVLHSTEAILIPGMLLASGLARGDALSLYAQSRAWPCPCFSFPPPSPIPWRSYCCQAWLRIRPAAALARICRTIESTLHYCLMLGIFAAGVFFFFGPRMGELIFDSPEAGSHLKILAFLCPFLYINGTLSSIISGLGKTRFHLTENAASLGLRIVFILLAVPRAGIRGYQLGLLAGEIAAALLNLCFFSAD